MYFPYFMAYMTAGLMVSVLVFGWALRNGQFRDQQRARYLPLEEEADAGPARVTRMGRLETYVLMALAVSGLLASGAVLLFSLMRS